MYITGPEIELAEANMEDNQQHLRQTLEYYRAKKAKRTEEFRAEIAALDIQIHELEKELGESPSNDSGVETMSFPPSEPFATIGTTGPSVRPDEFFGMSQSEAAKAYLRKIGRAISLDQLVDALKKGGANLGGVNPKKTLYVSLARNPMKEFVNPSEGFVGLREFYPNLAKARKR